MWIDDIEYKLTVVSDAWVQISLNKLDWNITLVFTFMTLPLEFEQHAPYTATLMSEQVKGPVTRDFALRIPDNEIFGLNNFQLISLITTLKQA